MYNATAPKWVMNINLQAKSVAAEATTVPMPLQVGMLNCVCASLMPRPSREGLDLRLCACMLHWDVVHYRLNYHCMVSQS